MKGKRKITVLTATNQFDRICAACGMSRKEVARRAGISPGAVSKWGSGERRPRDVYALYRVALALDVRIEDLLEPEEVKAIRQEVKEACAAEEKRQHASRLPDPARDQLPGAPDQTPAAPDIDTEDMPD